MGGKSFTSVEPTKFAQVVVGVFVNPQVESCVDAWIPSGPQPLGAFGSSAPQILLCPEIFCLYLVNKNKHI